jgi:hypothetical protein
MSTFSFSKELTLIKYHIKGFLISDKLHAVIRFKRNFGRPVNLKDPKTFNEKLQWLKLYYRKPVYTVYADKYSVRNIISEKIGEHVLNDLYATYDNVDEIDFDALPNSFVLKTTHASGTNIICRDKSGLNIKEVKQTLKYWLKSSYYLRNREWPYKNIKKRIVCEKFLEPKNNEPLYDYKLFCFDGKVKYILVDIHISNKLRRAFYNTKWEKQPFSIKYDIIEEEIPRPERLDEMIKYAEILSENEPFLRIDFYYFDKKIVFGEITMYPGNGYNGFIPEKYDYHFGQLLKLPDPVL